MVLWGSLLALLASVAGLATLGSSYFLGDVSAVGFVISLFVLVCATEARTRCIIRSRLCIHPCSSSWRMPASTIG